MSVSARRRWRCAPPSSPPWKASRWRSSCRPRCWRASISRPSPSVSPACRSWCAGLALVGEGTRRDEEGHRRRHGRHRRRHACAAGKSIKFKNLGLLIVDEEQHFGVKHKERLKELKSDVHVLTLSATPIPRTLQLALTGRARAVADRHAAGGPLAVRTFISPFDPLVIRETLLRERYRGGQSFYVVPRIADLARDRGVPESRAGAGTQGRRRARPDGAGRSTTS
jgi:hypothetical protein